MGLRPMATRHVPVLIVGGGPIGQSDRTRMAGVDNARLAGDLYRTHFSGGDVPAAAQRSPSAACLAGPLGRRVTAEPLRRTLGDKARWAYDFGDGWEHDVVIEAICELDPVAVYPRCIKGRRACPPEDCGGWWGYANLLEAVADPSHDEHAELAEWLPPDFDAEHFDADEATEAMQSPPLGECW